jgi:hypothetical protein
MTKMQGMLISFFAIIAIPQLALADDTITMSERAPFSREAHIPPAVRTDCQLESKLPDFIEKYSRSANIPLNVIPGKVDPHKGKVLKIEITNTMGTGGGAWSGPKSVTAVGELFENGKKIGSFTSTRYSGGGAFGGFKGTCSIMGRCVKTMGKDISIWLKSPIMDARLGNAE